MEHAKRLYLIDEFDRQYKQLQRPAASAAKARSVIQLNDTLRNRNLDEHEKARQYVAELHRYLNVNAPGQRQQQQQPAAKRKPKRPVTRFNTLASPPPPVFVPPPVAPAPQQLGDDYDDALDLGAIFGADPPPRFHFTAPAAPPPRHPPKKRKKTSFYSSDWAQLRK